ncbi:MAG: uroporphyrinogen decarboxylase family protein [Clostridia bacterium]
MNSRERLLNSIKGYETDRIAWSPFLPYYWESLPESVRKSGMLEFYKSIGADPLFRGYCTLIKKEYKYSSISEKTEGKCRQVLIETPVGSLEFLYSYSEQGDTWFLTGHPIKCEEDYKILTYLNEDMIIKPDFSRYEAGMQAMGKEALLIPIIGSEMKSSYQSLLENWAGTVEATYAVYDFPETLGECLYAMKQNSRKAVEIAVQCGAEAYIFWEDSSTGNISPDFFRLYVADEISGWADILHREGKYLIHHACGQLRNLLPEMAKTGIDVIESMSPPPTGDIYTYEARALLPDNIGLIGGIEPTVLLNYNMEDLAEYVREIIEKTGKHRFILGNADSCPPGVEKEKFVMISEIVKNSWR